MQHIELAIHCLKFQQIFDLEIVITGKPNKSKSNLKGTFRTNHCFNNKPQQRRSSSNLENQGLHQ